ncbi:MAG: SDR family oxidoreductase [Verrucomicrobiae bacterium]|nr:SDR family oxidoreductase [Verrucomicrobiae bacterium]
MTRTVLITGSSSGIGLATAKYFAAKGWNVIATLRDPAAEKELARFNNILVAQMDVRDGDGIHSAVAAGLARFAKIDVLVNNAGFSLSGVFEGIPRERIQEQFEVNVLGVMDVTRALLPHFRQNHGGMIINISSRAGLVGLPMISLYCATKYALEGFSESLAFELASQNIAVKLIEPSGGVSSTNFGKRLGEERAQTAAPADYDAFIGATNAAYGAMRASRMVTSAEVAQVIYEAATDGTARLRYFIGEDVGGFVAAKQGMVDQDYVDFMRARFQPSPVA